LGWGERQDPWGLGDQGGTLRKLAIAETHMVPETGGVAPIRPPSDLPISVVVWGRARVRKSLWGGTRERSGRLDGGKRANGGMPPSARLIGDEGQGEGGGGKHGIGGLGSSLSTTALKGLFPVKTGKKRTVN